MVCRIVLNLICPYANWNKPPSAPVKLLKILFKDTFIQWSKRLLCFDCFLNWEINQNNWKTLGKIWNDLVVFFDKARNVFFQGVKQLQESIS